MHFNITGVSHKTLPIAWREKLYLQPEMVTNLLAELKRDPRVLECVLLSTCNRTEMFLVLKELSCIKSFQEQLCEALNVDAEAIRESWYTFKNEEAVHHLFRVTSSLDSLVVGETQVFGQVRDAYQLAHAHGSTASILNQLLHRAFAASKRIRSETGLGMGALSLSSIAVELLNENLCTRHTPTLLVLGSGEMGKITAKTFTERNLGKLIIINRTFAKAEKLAAELSAEAKPWEELMQWLFQADAVVTSCSSETPLLGKLELSNVMSDRPQRSLTLVDLGVPRNIHADATEVNGVRLYNVDNLQDIAKRNQSNRQSAAIQAEVVALDEARKAAHDVLVSSIGAEIAELQKKYELIRESELEKTLQQLSHLNLTEDDKSAISACTESLVRKLLHAQIQRIREKDSHDQSCTISTAVLS